MSMSKEALGVTIKKARKARGLRQEDVAVHLGVNPKQVGRWEKGENAPGSLFLVRMLKFFRQRLDQPDLAELDAIVAQEVNSVVKQDPSERERALVLLDELIQYPYKFEQWLDFGSDLLDDIM